MRDLFGAPVTAPPVTGALDEEADDEPPLLRAVLPPGTRLVTFGTRQQTGSTCPLTGEPAAFGACLDCLYYRGPAGLGVACGHA
ncbi:MAG: hypothetical protein KKA73_19330 [Chloroflexi bacterium]|nr:hypothetical protein [Chloroflexota bacterium]MBU1749842.1 hypothetical protein [Chloroflexota bacterium]MBU1877318.1 hypothetical protein [Chloroflexota bacterium]